MAPEARGTSTGGSGERRLTVEYVAARVLLDAASIEEAASGILQAICESLGWEHGALWTVDAEGDCLRCAQIWSASASRFPEFHAISQGMTFRRGIGLPGRVWESRTPAWIPDVVADTNFPRAPIAAREGLHAAFGFPVLLRGEVFGVMEFFSREIREPDEHLLPMLTTVGNQIGLFIERRRAQDELSLLFTLSPDMLCIAGLDGYLKRVNPAWQNILGYTEAELLSRPYIEFGAPGRPRGDARGSKETVRRQPGRPFRESLLPQRRHGALDAVGRGARHTEISRLSTRPRVTSRNARLPRNFARAPRISSCSTSLLATLTDSGDLPRHVRADFGHRAKSVAARRSRITGVFARRPPCSSLRQQWSESCPGRRTGGDGNPSHVLRPDWEYDLLDDLTVRSEATQQAVGKHGIPVRAACPHPTRRPSCGFAEFSLEGASGVQAGRHPGCAPHRRSAGRDAGARSRNRRLQAGRRGDGPCVAARSARARADRGAGRPHGISPRRRRIPAVASGADASDAGGRRPRPRSCCWASPEPAKKSSRGSCIADPRANNGPFIALNCAALAGAAARSGVVRIRARRVHGGDAEQAWPARTGRRRHAVSRRGCGDESVGAGQVPARAAGA